MLIKQQRTLRVHGTPCVVMGFPGGASGKEPPAETEDVRDLGSIPGSGQSPGGKHGSAVQYSCLENLMDRGAWWATVHGVAQIWTRLKQLSTPALLGDTQN